MPVFPGCHPSFYRAKGSAAAAPCSCRNVPRPTVGIHSAQVAQHLRDAEGLESSGGIEPPGSPCAWGCACQSTCCPCCRRGYRAPAAGIGIRRVRRRCASGSCTRQAGSMDTIPDCHLGGAIWSTIYGWWSTAARDVNPGQYRGTGVRLPRAIAVGRKGENRPQLPRRVGAMYFVSPDPPEHPYLALPTAPGAAAQFHGSELPIEPLHLGAAVALQPQDLSWI